MYSLFFQRVGKFTRTKNLNNFVLLPALHPEDGDRPHEGRQCSRLNASSTSWEGILWSRVNRLKGLVQDYKPPPLPLPSGITDQFGNQCKVLLYILFCKKNKLQKSMKKIIPPPHFNICNLFVIPRVCYWFAGNTWLICTCITYLLSIFKLIVRL